MGWFFLFELTFETFWDNVKIMATMVCGAEMNILGSINQFWDADVNWDVNLVN